MRSGDRAFRFVRASSQAATDTGLLIEGCPSVQSGRHGHRPAHRGFVRPFSQAATDTDLLIEGCPSVQSGRHGHRPAHRGLSVRSVRPPRTPTCSSRVVRPFSQAATDTDLLIEGCPSVQSGRHGHRPAHRGLSVRSVRPPRTPTCSSRVVRPFSQAATDTDLLIEGCPSVQSGRHGNRPAHRGFVRPFDQAATDTALLIEAHLGTGPRHRHRPAHRGFVRPFDQAATDTDLLIEGRPSFRSGRHGHRPAHRGGGRHSIRRGHRPAHRGGGRHSIRRGHRPAHRGGGRLAIRWPQEQPQAVPL
jgi:hypothetical protein